MRAARVIRVHLETGRVSFVPRNSLDAAEWTTEWNESVIEELGEAFHVPILERKNGRDPL